tara:strand:+ start:8821 stop:9003 length:183 start_codon:yes stop_codon:yes gene_type:complete
MRQKENRKVRGITGKNTKKYWMQNCYVGWGLSKKGRKQILSGAPVFPTDYRVFLGFLKTF